METNFDNCRLWSFSGNPDSSVHNSLNVFPNAGDIFVNSSNNNIFYCAQSGGDSQIWQQCTNLAQVTSLIAAIPAQVQSDWNQANTLAVDYIKNKPSISTRSQSSVSRSLNTAFQISSTRDTLAVYSVDIATALSLTTGQSGVVILEIATNSAFTTGVQEVSRIANSQTGTLTIGLGLNQNVTDILTGYIPSGYWVRLRTSNIISTPTYTYKSGQEVLL